MNKIIWFLILMSGVAMMAMIAIFQYNIVITTSQMIIILLVMGSIAGLLAFRKYLPKKMKGDEMKNAIEFCKEWWHNMYNEDLTRLEGEGKRATFYNPVDTKEKKSVIGLRFFRGSGEQRGLPVIIIYGNPNQILYWNDNPAPEELRNVFANYHPFITEEFRGRVPKTISVQPTIDIEKLGEKKEFEKLKEEE